jgi:DNA repair protein RecO (recombination protein O)
MHHKFHTEAIVIQSHPFGEANKVYTLFTPDFGMVHASAQGVRLGKSKLKHALQDFSYVRVDLVRGKEFWRITSATALESFPCLNTNTKERYIVARIAYILGRLHAEEEESHMLFSYILAVYREASSIDEKDLEKYILLEIGAISHILSLLGYGYDEMIHDIQNLEKIDESFYEIVRTNKQKMITHINKALKASHL